MIHTSSYVAEFPGSIQLSFKDKGAIRYLIGAVDRSHPDKTLMSDLELHQIRLDQTKYVLCCIAAADFLVRLAQW